MNDILKLVFLTLIQPLIDAIDRNTAAQGGAAKVTPTEGKAEATDTPAPTAPAKEKKSKKTEAPAPEPKEEPKPEVKEEDDIVVPTGAELVTMMSPLCEDPWKTKCIDFRKNVLKFDKPTRQLEDPVLRAKFADFINGLLKEQAEADSEV